MVRETTGVIVIDDGGYNTNICTKDVQTSFRSSKSYLTTEPNLLSITGENDLIVEFNNQRFLAADLSVYDGTLPLEMNSFGKNHLFFDLSVYIAIFKYGYVNNKIVVTLPIKSFTKEEIENRKKRLEGSKTITINGKTKTFFIEEVKVVPECAISFFNKKEEGKTHYIDIGSRTVNVASVLYQDQKYRFLDSESDTYYSVGLQALGNRFNARSLSDYIGGRTIKMFNPENTVYVLGGGALNMEIIHYLKEYYPKLEVMENPTMSNATGAYELAKGAFGID